MSGVQRVDAEEISPRPTKNGLRARSWVFTLNNYSPEELLEVERIDCKYMVFGKELGEDNQVPHLQGYLHFKDQKALSTLKKLMPRAHFEIARGNAEENYNYCTKQGDFIEKGTRPISQKRKGEMEQERWATIKAQAIAGDLESIDPKVYVSHYRTLKAIAKDHMKPPNDLEGCCGHWYYGEAGSGKTTAARSEHPGAFIKSRDKWWCGYQGEDVVILDDMDPFHKGLAAYFKDWADKWTFKAEDKGGCKWIRPKKFIVTSQYHPSDIWDDKETLDAISRRYEFRLFRLSQR